MNQRIKHIVIVGGGSAGWLTAGVLAAGHHSRDLSITLVESPDVNPIGVGEGTWPSMRDSLRKMGVSETDFIRECDASFKQASRFDRWVTGASDDRYYHPFAMPQGYGDVDLHQPWQSCRSELPFAEALSYQPHLCAMGKAPKQKATPEWAAVANYAYHLDAGKFGLFLRKHCVGKLSVKHVLDHVEQVNSAENGDIESLQTQSHGAIEADLFIDCTGFASILLGQHFGVPFVDRKETLFCDSALAIQVPYAEVSSPVASNTISTAQDSGWIWDIGLPTRRGVGHVYSSAHTSDEQAEKALVSYLESSSASGVMDTLSNGPRKLDIRPGHRRKFWHRNCVAVGISAGFIEPLEASALALIELSAAMIRDELPASRDNMDVIAKRFNDRFLYRWDRIIDFLKLHYVLSQRNDTDFWRDHHRQDTIPDRLTDLMRLWRLRPPSRRDFYEIEEIFPAASYQYVLYGMGFKPDPSEPAEADQEAIARTLFTEVERTTGKFMSGLPSHRDLIDHIALHGMQGI